MPDSEEEQPGEAGRDEEAEATFAQNMPPNQTDEEGAEEKDVKD